MKNIFITIITFFVITNSFAQNEMVLRIKNANQASYQYFVKNNDEITAYRKGEYLDILANQNRYQDLLNQGWEFEVTQTTEKNIQHLTAAKDINGYHTYDEALAYLQQIAADYPEICTLTDIGDSHGKEYFNNGVTGYQDYQHDIWMLKISDNVNENEDEPAVFYFGAHHAREPISTEVVLGIIEHLTSNYGSNDEITNMIDNSEIYIVPMVNPDGHEVVLDQLNTWWRKTAADNDNNGQFNYTSDGPDGVDPNRNYGWNFGGDGSSGDPSSDTYHGPVAFSEPGIAAMRDLMASHHFTSGITYHSYSELVLYPYGYSDNIIAPDNDALAELAVNMAQSIPKITGSGHYTPEQSNDLYPASGVTDDWAYGNHGIFCYTVELGMEFIPPASQVSTIINDNIDAAMMILNRPNHQVLRGHVYDAETLEPIVAKVAINSIDETGSYREPYKSDAEFGAYYRLLTAGSFNVNFSAYGYLPQDISNVEITNNEATVLDVYLDRAVSGPVIGSVLDGISGENLEGVEISFLDTPLESVYTNENGVYEEQYISYSTYTIRVDKEGYSPLYTERTITVDQYIINFVLLPSEAITFEEGVFNDDFSMSGSQDWIIDANVSYEGDYSAASGNINDNQSSIMTLNSNNRAGGAISFYTKVSTESGYDFLKFYIDGTEQDRWSGEADWQEVIYQVTEGEHDYKWTYQKDSNTTGGSDKTWVDYIQIPPVLTTVVNAGPDMFIMNGDDVNPNAYAADYQTITWTSSGDGSFNDSGILNPVYTPGENDNDNGFVELTITASGDQTVSDALFVEISVYIGIDKLDVQQEFSFSPNPSDDFINISFQGSTPGFIEIYNISGILIAHEFIQETQKQISVDVSYLPSGVYIIKYTNNKGLSNTQQLLVK